MTDQSIFAATSPRFGLPLLFPGQAQKEAFVNEALALADALLHCAVEGEAGSPPASPIDGSAWLVAAGSTGEWLGKDGMIASRQFGNWLYVAPRDGMRVFNRLTGQNLIYFKAWNIAAAPSEPSGGQVVDSEARAAILELIAALRVAGVLPAT